MTPGALAVTQHPQTASIGLDACLPSLPAAVRHFRADQPELRTARSPITRGKVYSSSRGMAEVTIEQLSSHCNQKLDVWNSQSAEVDNGIDAQEAPVAPSVLQAVT